MSAVSDLGRSALIFAFFLLPRKTWWLADMEPALHVAPADGPGGADGRRQSQMRGLQRLLARKRWKPDPQGGGPPCQTNLWAAPAGRRAPSGRRPLASIRAVLHSLVRWLLGSRRPLGFHSPAARLPSHPSPRNWLLIGPRLPKTVRALDPSRSARRCCHAS